MSPHLPARPAGIPYLAVVAFGFGFVATFAAMMLVQSVLLAPLLP